jgi:uncharacterized repeat protein (TIGR04076 family)
MFDRHKLKITVLRRFSPSEVLETLPVTPSSTLEACGVYEDGQEITVEENMRMPEGFCPSAWQSIYCTIRTLGHGGGRWGMVETFPGTRRRASPSAAARTG